MPKAVLVPLLLFLSGTMMAFAWIGHLKYRTSWSFWLALGISWLIVLPEYVLNVGATRFGRDVYTGAQMAAFHLCSGVVWVCLISRFYLREPLSLTQLLGFALMAVSIVLVMQGNGVQG
jgi:uncharacterized protein